MIPQTLNALNQKKTILYPTDTVWGIGGDATVREVVQKIYTLKEREDHKALIVLVDSKEMLLKYIDEFPDAANTLIESDRPTTVIYPKGIGFAQNLFGTDQSIGIRISKNEFCQKLIKNFGKPIISTSANKSGSPTPKHYKEIEKTILDGVDYIVPLKEENSANNPPSRVIKILPDGELEILRP